MFFWNALRRASVPPTLIRAVQATGFLLTLASIALTVYQGITEITFGDWQQFVAGLLISFGAYGASFSLQGIAWCLLIGSLSQTRTGWRDLEIYAYSNLMRRTPGTIWYLIKRVERYRHRGLNALVTLAASAAEWVLLITAAAVVYALTWLNQVIAALPIAEIASLMILALLGILALGRRARPFNIRASQAQGITLPNRLVMSLPKMCMVWLVYSVCYVFGGIIVFALVHIVNPTSPLVFAQAISLWALMGGIGLLSSVIIPVNLGLREFTLAVILLPFTTAAAAITVAAMVRVVFALADVTFSVGLWQLSRWIRSYKEASQTTH